MLLSTRNVMKGGFHGERLHANGLELYSFDPAESVPLNLCMIETRVIFGKVYSDIVPAAVNENGQVVPRPGWWMFGGNIAYSSDSRFDEEVGNYYPVKIRDRRE